MSLPEWNGMPQRTKSMNESPSVGIIKKKKKKKKQSHFNDTLQQPTN